MATESKRQVELPEMTPQDILNGMSTIMKMIIVGAVFAAVGYLLVIGALVVEFTQFHPLLDAFFVEHTGHSLAGGGADRAGMAALNSDLGTIHKFPSLLLWMKLGGIAHVLVGIFIVLAAIVRTLAMVPHRLSYAMED